MVSDLRSRRHRRLFIFGEGGRGHENVLRSERVAHTIYQVVRTVAAQKHIRCDDRAGGGGCGYVRRGFRSGIVPGCCLSASRTAHGSICRLCLYMCGQVRRQLLAQLRAMRVGVDVVAVRVGGYRLLHALRHTQRVDVDGEVRGDLRSRIYIAAMLETLHVFLPLSVCPVAVISSTVVMCSAFMPAYSSFSCLCCCGVFLLLCRRSCYCTAFLLPCASHFHRHGRLHLHD